MESATSWIGNTLGALNPGYVILGLLRPALDLFRSETVAPNLSTLMVLVAALLIVAYWLTRIRPACKLLDERIAFLKRCQSPAAFYAEIDAFNALMSRVGFLAHGWSEFAQTCLFSRRHGQPNVEISVRPSVFINLDDSEHSGLNIRWFHHLSGIFVGLGLLLTFIGLVAALYFSSAAINLVIDATRGLSTPDQTKAIQKALAQLLNTATFKFLTSIAGLGCSMVLGFFARKWVALLERKFQDLCRELERCTLTVTPEQLAERQHQELGLQTDLLETLPAHLEPAIARALESALANALPGLLGAALAPVIEKLGEATHAIVNARQAPFHAMAEEFNATVTHVAGREIKAVAETLSGLPTQISSAAETLSVIPSQMTAATTDLQRVLVLLTTGMEAFQARVAPTGPDPALQALAADIGRSIDGLKTTLVDQAAARPKPDFDAEKAALTEISYTVSRIEAALHSNAVAIAARLDGLRANTTESARILADETLRSVSAMTTAAERLGAGLDEALRHLHERSEQSANEIAERFLEAAKAAKDATRLQSARIEEAVEMIAVAGLQAGQGVGQAAAAAAETLGQQALGAAEQVVDASTQVLAQFRTTVERLSHQIDGLSQALGAVEYRIAGHATALEGVNRSARETETALSASARAVGAATIPLARVGEAMVQSMTTLARTLETTVGGLTESQTQGQALASTLRETLQQLKAIWSRHENRFADVDASLSRVLTSIIEHVDAHGAALRDHVVKIDTHLAQTVNNLAGNVEALQETASELTRAIAAIHKVVDSLPAPAHAVTDQD